jgi:hypothetical protein
MAVSSYFHMSREVNESFDDRAIADNRSVIYYGIRADRHTLADDCFRRDNRRRMNKNTTHGANLP